MEEAGWSYPESYDAKGRSRHQFIVSGLLSGKLRKTVKQTEDLAAGDQKNVLYSSEGMFLQSGRFKTALPVFLKALKPKYRVEVICTFRQPNDFVRSLFKQVILSYYVDGDAISHYSGTLEAFRLEPYVQDLLDYDARKAELERAADQCHWLDYQTDMLSVFEEKFFGVALDRNGLTPNNSNPDHIMYEIIRISNGFSKDASLKRELRRRLRNWRRNPPSAELVGLLEQVRVYSGEYCLAEPQEVAQRLEQMSLVAE